MFTVLGSREGSLAIEWGLSVWHCGILPENHIRSNAVHAGPSTNGHVGTARKCATDGGVCKIINHARIAQRPMASCANEFSR